MPKNALPPVQSVRDLPPVLAVLRPKERAFAEYMALYNDVHKSAKLAGYTNASSGYELQYKPEVSCAIDYFRAVFAEASHMTPHKILRELTWMATSDITEYFNDDWTLKLKKDLPVELRRALVGLEFIPTKYGLRARAKFAKVEALVALGRIFGMEETGKDQEESAPGTSVTIHLGARTPEEKDVTPESVQIGNLTIIAGGKQE